MAEQTINLEQEKMLFERLKKDPEAIGEVYDRYSKQLYSYLLKRCGHKETAEDLVAQSFMKLLESAPNLEWRGVPVSAWLYRVATNALADHWRSSATRKSTSLDDDDEGWDPPAPDDTSWLAEMSIEGDRLKAAMNQLSKRDQEVLALKFYTGLATEEIAVELSISNNHAAVLIYRALGRMRKLLIQTTN
ncbi:MAG: RNA polymerase sigma factor [Patescibacteria group bacterium]|nr:RNA polymerase sigma factor [Patescibacteria group bacterium]